MSIPVLQIDGFLIASIQDAVEDSVALELRQNILEGIRRTRARGILIDATGVDIVDSFTARVLGGIGRTAHLLGARTVLVGLQPEVAMTMVELGLELQDIATELNVERGLQFLREQVGGARSGRGR